MATATDIRLSVARHYGLTVEQLTSADRHRPIARARQVAYYLIRSKTKLSLPAIGALFGCRDHQTILYGCRKIVDRMEADPRFKAEVLTIPEVPVHDPNRRYG